RSPKSRSDQRSRLKKSHQRAKRVGQAIEPKKAAINCVIGSASIQRGTLRTSQYSAANTTPGHKRRRGSGAGGHRVMLAATTGDGAACGRGAGGTGDVASYMGILRLRLGLTVRTLRGAIVPSSPAARMS